MIKSYNIYAHTLAPYFFLNDVNLNLYKFQFKIKIPEFNESLLKFLNYTHLNSLNE